MAGFPKRVARISGPPPRIDYKSELPDDPLLDEVDDIVEFALPRFNATLTEGRQRWDDLAATLTLEPVGLMPLRPDEGYLLFMMPHRQTCLFISTDLRSTMIWLRVGDWFTGNCANVPNGRWAPPSSGLSSI